MNKVLKRSFLAVVSVAAVASIASCGGSGSTTESKYLIVSINTGVESLDSQVATDGTSFEVMATYLEGLYRVDGDGNAVLGMAKSVDKSSDGKTYTFTLRDDAYWYTSDGKQYAPVTAKDFVFGWQRGDSPELQSEYQFMFSDVALIKNAADVYSGKKALSELGITAVSDKVLKVELDSPVTFFDKLMYFPTFYPVNQAFFESVGGTDGYGTSPEKALSNGPFMLESYAPSAVSFSLKKNAGYYDASSVKIDGVNYKVYQEDSTAYLAYKNGDLDIAPISGELVDSNKSSSEFNSVEAGYLWYISPNLQDANHPEIANEDFRKALNLAIDRQAICDTLLKDGSVAAEYAVPEKLATGPDGKDYRETASTYDYTEKGTKTASNYMGAAKKALGKDSFSLALECDNEASSVAEMIQAQIQKALPEVKITLNPKVKKQRVADMQNGDFEICLTRWGPDYADPMTYLGMWKTGNSNNYGLWSNAKYDQLISDCTDGAYATDPSARWAHLKEAEDIVMDEAVIIPVYQKGDSYLISSGVSGIEFHAVALNRVFRNVTKK